ncbi:MAG: sxtJ [Nitrospinae bacterium]|nr:sxtJ [Nitrospinota bacterium]
MALKQPPEKILRSFGLTMGAVLSLVSGASAYKGVYAFLPIPVLLAVVFIAFALAAPLKLEVVHRPWMRFAEALGAFNAKLILGFVYFTIFTPIRVFFLITGKDPLKRKFEPHLETYWEDHVPSGEAPGRYEKQF